MKVVYLNDTRKPQAVFLHSLSGFVKNLAPAESITLDFHIAEAQAVFVKVWDGRVLIGRTDYGFEDAK